MSDGFNRDEIEAEIRAQFAKDLAAGAYDDELQRFMEDEVVPAWQQNSPDDSGDYKDSVEVKHPAKNGRGAVGTKIGYAHIIEYGSDKVPEYAPRARAAASFNNGSSGDYEGRRRVR